MSKGAFTLVETVLVLLMISLVLIFISFRPPSHLTEEIESRLFFEEVLSRLKLSQQQAIIQNKNIAVIFSVGTQMFTIQDRTVGQLIFRTELPEHIRLTKGSEFLYYPQGGISNFNTVVFQNTRTGQLISLVFQLGNGQFELQQ